MSDAIERGAPGAGSDSTPAPAPPAPWPRMGLAILSLLGLFIAGYLLLHRLGLVGRLLCGPAGSCETVQASS